MYTGFFDEKNILVAEDKVIGDAFAAEMPTAMFYQYVRGIYDLAHAIMMREGEES